MLLQPVMHSNVNIESPLWSRITETVRRKTIPAIVEAQKNAGHWTCLTWQPGHNVEPHPFWDSDIYKILEATCYVLMKHDDTELWGIAEDAVSMIEKGQHSDGYINSHYTVRGIENRWTNLRDNHEMYCLGHFLEAAVAYETLTNSGRLLKVARKVVQHVDSMFGLEHGKKRGYPGHQEIEIGLLRLYEFAGDELCLKVAKYFILERGTRDENDEIYFDHEAKARGADPYDHMGTEMKAQYLEPRDYGCHQADIPVVKADSVKGHSVRAMYYYTAATDLFRLVGNKDESTSKIGPALDRLWQDMVGGKMYVTGAIGSVRQWEGFGPAFSLPDLEEDGCYAETCATFALINWCQRLLRIDLNAKYSDVMEIALYNGFLGAMNVAGDAFYYQNVLRTTSGKPKERSKWFGVACCPPNVAKLLGNLGSLIYSHEASSSLTAIHLYIESDMVVPETETRISQKTNMPWRGQVTITIAGTTNLALRIPSWATNDKWHCSASGEVRGGYLYLSNVKDATIELGFSVRPRKIYAHPNTGKDEICLARGPLIYCIEDVDNSGIDIDHLLMKDADIVESHGSVTGLDEVTTLAASCLLFAKSNDKSLYPAKPWSLQSSPRDVVAIPYFLRANRGGKGAMRVWTPRYNALEN